MVAALNALARMPDGGAAYREDLVRALDGADQYWSSSGRPPGYASGLTTKNGGGRKFYDDNEWMGLELVEAYRTLKDPKYLQKAQDVFRFVISGWSDELGGGIYWREWKDGDPPPTKNTCSNGPAAVLAMKLYEETKDPAYLEWAQRILDWVVKLRTPDYVYWDHLNSDGSINKGAFTYNVGTVLEANALLYKATGEKRYLEEARKLADGSLAHFAKRDASAGLAFYPKTPWFNVVLFRGYIELYRVDPEKKKKYIEAMRSNVLYAWEHARDSKGLFSKDWSGKTGIGEAHKRLLDKAPMVEFYALLAQVE
jgi:predicted alpha-1,6-mannanase (GH76 family)